MEKNDKKMPDAAGLTHIEESVDMYIPRIMVIGDEEFLVRLLNRELKGKGYEIDTCSSFAKGMKLLKTNTYRLILCDMEVDGVSSISMLVYCRHKYKNSRVILLADKSEMKFAVEAMKNGASSVLSKPINLNELLTQLKEALSVPKVETVFDMGVTVPSGCELIKEIGKGNVCTVYLVERDGAKMAMKIPNGNSWNMERLKRFFREADTLSKIAHPNIVQIYEYGVSDYEEIPYIIMEYLPGGTLDAHLRRNMVNIDEGITIIVQLLSALKEVHGHGLLHRDIKPQNVLFSERHEIKLSDFGLVRITDSALTMSHVVLGTPGYMSPESFEGSRKIDERAEIFSMGVMAYEILTGTHPFDVTCISELISAIKASSPLAPTKLNPKIPQNLQTVLAGMLAKKPENRYNTAEEALRDFENFRKLRFDFTPMKKFDDLDVKKTVWRD